MIVKVYNVSLIIDLPDLMVSIYTSGSTEVGQSLNITCTAVLVEGVHVNMTWEKIDIMNGETIPMERVTDGAVTNVTLILDPVQFSYRGMYMCEAEYNVSQTSDDASATETASLVVDCELYDTMLCIVCLCVLIPIYSSTF